MVQQYDWKLGIALLMGAFLFGCKPKDTATPLSDSQAAVQKMCFANGSPSSEQRKLINQAAEELKAIDEDVLCTLLAHLEDLPADKSFGSWERPIIEALARRSDKKVDAFLAAHIDSYMETSTLELDLLRGVPCAKALSRRGGSGLCAILNYARSTNEKLSPTYVKYAVRIAYGAYNRKDTNGKSILTRETTELYLADYLSDANISSNRDRILAEYRSRYLRDSENTLGIR